MATFLNCMFRAAKLDPRVYEEVEADERAIGQALGVIVLSGVAGGVGFMQQASLIGMAFSTLVVLLAWFVWAFITYIIGTRVFPEPQTRADHGELLRTIGFSNAPGIIRIFAIIPGLHTVVNFVAGIWMLMAMVIAVRQALDYYSTSRAIGVCLTGWLVQAVILTALVIMMATPVASHEPFALATNVFTEEIGMRDQSGDSCGSGSFFHHRLDGQTAVLYCSAFQSKTVRASPALDVLS